MNPHVSTAATKTPAADAATAFPEANGVPAEPPPSAATAAAAAATAAAAAATAAAAAAATAAAIPSDAPPVCANPPAELADFYSQRPPKLSDEDLVVNPKP